MNSVRLFLRGIVGNITDVRDDTFDLITRRHQPRWNNEFLTSLPVTTCGSGDGRWFLCGEGLSENSTVYSVGVGYDISFDIDVIRNYGCQVHAFDPTLISKRWLESKTDLPKNFIHHDIGLAHYSGVANFSLPANHSVSFSMSSVVSEKDAGSDLHEAEVKTLDDIMENLGHQEIDLLKIDIEGAEYDIIDDLVNNATRIKQLLIEFHDRLIGEEVQKPSQDAIQKLQKAGFRVFNISRRGYEYTLLGPSFSKA